MCVLQLGNPNQLLFSDSWGGEHVVLFYECGPGIAEQKPPQVVFICKGLFKTALYRSFLFYWYSSIWTVFLNVLSCKERLRE